MTKIGKLLFAACAYVITLFVIVHVGFGNKQSNANATSAGAQPGSITTREPRIVTASYDPITDPNGNSVDSDTTGNVTSNWAGYVSTGGKYTSVSGSWTVPNVSVDASNSADAAWIGIGGENSADLIQVGTQNTVENGQVTASSFYEGLPETSQTIPNMAVSPGDKIFAGIKETSPGMWDIKISDETNGQSFNTMVQYNSDESSAEWIEEAPSSTYGNIPLDSFNAINFTDIAATENGSTVNLASLDPQAMTMVNSAGEALTSTSAVNAAGTGFSVSRTSASSDPYGQNTDTGYGSGSSEYPGYTDTSGTDGYGWGGPGSVYEVPSTGDPHNSSHWRHREYSIDPYSYSF